MIAILMSTYNGEKYLAEQIDSIINQSYKDWSLFIRDDGSTDGTNVIIDDYIKKEGFNIKRIVSEESNLGPAQSFMKMLQIVEAEYYMFADQDDFWLSDKIECSLQKMIEIKGDENLPVLVHTDLLVVDQDLNLLSRSFWGKNLTSEVVYKYMPITNFVTGCTMFFNKAARDCSINFTSDKIIMHDHWVALCVWANQGIIFSISEPTIKYRQHGRNVLGVFKRNSSFTARLSKSISHNLDVWRMVRTKKNVSMINFLYLKVAYSLIKKQIKNVQ